MNKVDKDILKIVAVSLKSLVKDVVFVGGVTTSIYIQDEPAPRTTPTEDVDLIVNIATRIEYVQFERKLSNLGFKRDMHASEPICRFHLNDIIVDVMPLDEKILGFSNRWYADGFKSAVEIDIEGVKLKILSFDYFIATKLEALKSRGLKGFLRDSKDLEDVVVVLNGRINLEQDLENLSHEIKLFLKEMLEMLFTDEDIFREAIITSLMDYGSSIASQKASKLLRQLQDWRKSSF